MYTQILPMLKIQIRTIFLGMGILISILSLLNLNNYSDVHQRNIKSGSKLNNMFENNTFPTVLGNADFKIKLIQKKIERLSHKIRTQAERKVSFETIWEPNYNVHLFYYSWYRCPPIDKKLKYWNNEKRIWNSSNLIKNEEPVLTNYFPQLGFYSSRNASVIDIHMKQIRRIGAGVILVAWYPSDIDDSPEDNLSLLMDKASKYDIKICLHIKSYSNRNPISLLKHLKRFIDKFQHHKALYRFSVNNRLLPVYYIYDPQDIDSDSWKQILSPDGALGIRGTKYDGVFIGLLSDMEYRYEIKRSNFDGFYTYFASNGMTYGATWKNWISLNKFAKQNSLLFVPCVSPGYSDGLPDSYTRHRLHGNYYDVGWRSAIAANAPLLAITSFNAWNEGSQIEPAIPRSVGGYKYMDYGPEQPQFYLDLTGWWISNLKK